MEHPIGSQESRGPEELEDRNGKGVEFAKKGKKKKDGMRKELKGFGEFQVIRQVHSLIGAPGRNRSTTFGMHLHIQRSHVLACILYL